MTVYREACRDREQFRQERNAARLAAEAASRLKEEMDTVKRQRDDLQAQLVDSACQRAGSKARLVVLQRSKGFESPESGPGAASPSQSGVPAAPPATYNAQSLQFLASGLLEYAHLATRVMADAKPSCQQSQTIAGLARTTTMPDRSVDNLPKVEAEVASRQQNADRRYTNHVAGVQRLPERRSSRERTRTANHGFWLPARLLRSRHHIRPITVWYILLLSTSWC